MQEPATMTSNQDTRSGCRLHNFNQFEHFESPIDLWHGEGVQRLFYLALNLILLLMGSNKGRLLSGIVFLLLYPFRVVFCCLSISAEVTLFADRVHARLWPLALSSQLVHAFFVMNHWSRWSQYKAYGISIRNRCLSQGLNQYPTT